MTYSIRTELLGQCYGEDNDYDFTSLDNRETLERVLGGELSDLPELLTQWRAAMAGAVTEVQLRAAGSRLGMNRWDPPEGPSWARWAQWFETRLIEAIEHPETLIPPEQLPSPFRWKHRTAVELPLRMARRLAVDAVDQHADRVDAWLTSDRSTGCRLHLVADLGRPLGEIRDLADAPPAESDPDDDYVDPDATPETIVVARRPTTRVGIRLARSNEGEQSVLDIKGVHLAEPVEAPGDQLVRDRWPALASLLGGWFSDRERWLPKNQQFQLVRTEHHTYLRTAHSEGRELLSLGDADLRRAVRALGCYVEPPHLRLWLTWMFWRIETFWIAGWG